MKKLLAFILALLMILSLAACGGNGGTGTTASPSTTATPADPTDPADDTTGEPAGPEDSTEASNPSTESPEITTDAPADDTTVTPATTEIPTITTEPVGSDVVMLPTGAVANWEYAAPYVNPLGDAKLYEFPGADNGSDNYLVLKYTNASGESVEEDVYGTVYSFSVVNEKLTAKWVDYQMTEVLKGQKSAFRFGDAAENVVGYIIDESDSVRWYVEAVINEGSDCALSMIRVTTLEKGKSYKFSSSDFSGNYLYYRIAPGSNEVITLTVEFDKACESISEGISISRLHNLVVTKGDLEYRNSISTSINPAGNRISPRESQKQKFAVFTPTPGSQYIELCDLTEGMSFTLSISASEVRPVTYGTAPGKVVLKGCAELGAEIYPQFEFTYVEFEDVFSTENGDAVLAPLDAGYYTIDIGPKGFGWSCLRLTNIPVSSGRITEITLPDETWTSIRALIRAFGDEDTAYGNMEIIKMSVDGNKGTLIVNLYDPDEREFDPKPEEIKVSESGVAGKVTSVSRVTTPVDVIICMDTSGSMSESMEAAKAAAITFIEGLSDNSTVRIISFQNFITVHPGTTKSEAVAAMSGLKAIGATTMYDAAAKALELLGDSENGYVVVFSDGADSREPGIAGTGSSISSEDLYGLIEQSGKTVLTIGFGDGADPEILREMSSRSEGSEFFTAAEASDLKTVFTRISEKFGNQFVIEYERPEVVVDKASEVPVISFMIDYSASMHLDPSEYPGDDVDYRFNGMISIFDSFVEKLPAGTLIQSGKFNRYETVTGTLTSVKSDFTSFLLSDYPYGGTPINEALRTAIEQLKPVSSSKKVLVYFTDAALDVSNDIDQDELEFHALLAELKALGYRVLFVGLGGKDYIGTYADVFKRSAEEAGGDYIITSDPAEVEAKLNELLAKIDKPVSEKDEIVVGLSYETSVSADEKVGFSTSYFAKGIQLITKAGQVVVPGTLTVKDAGAYVKN